MRNLQLVLGSILVLLVTACSQEPVEIHYGSDGCAYCKMMITNDHFSAQLVTTKGKGYTFDSIECLAAYHRENSRQLQDAKLWVNNYNNPGQWLQAPRAQYVKSEVVQSPMGESLLALPSSDKAKKHTNEKPGKLMKWKEVKQLKVEMNR